MDTRFYTVKAPFDDTERGFLPTYNPLTALPNTSDLNKEINTIIEKLPELLRQKTLRTTIDALNAVYAKTNLTLDQNSKAQKNGAILFLSMLGQAYLFENSEQPINQLPAVIAKNLYTLCKNQQRLLPITYHDYVLHNWQFIDKSKGITLDNIEPIVTLTGTKDEAWFIKIHVVIEAISGKALFLLQKMNENLRHQPVVNIEFLINALKEITDTLTDVRKTIHRMKEHCDPNIFWNVLRPYLGGWEKVKSPNNNEPNGVILEDVVTKDTKPYSYSGPSGAQSSIIPALDGAFKIKHEINGMFNYLNNFKNYMPKKHQTAILLFAQHPINKFVNLIAERDLLIAYGAAVKSVELFRGAHLRIIHDYIYQPAKSQGIDTKHITGTGGAPIDGYLAGRLKDTTERRQEIEHHQVQQYKPR